MNKKLLGLVGMIALGVGSVSAIALQSHAQNAFAQATTTVAPAVASTPTQENATAPDTDNVQDQAGGVDTPDTGTSVTADKETKDDQGLVASSTQPGGVQDAEVNDGN